MKKLLLFFCSILLFVNFSNAQIEKCATMHVLEQHKQQNSPYIKQMEDINVQAQRWINANENNLNFDIKGRMLSIPVVVHVLFHQNDSANQNLQYPIIQSQIDVLNEDFRRFNPDTTQTRAVFNQITADAGIQFCLASKDPNGNATDGITRTKVTKSFNPFTAMDHMKSAATGGKDPWPSDKYLNLWVCDMSFAGFVFVLGYAQFPGDNPLTDGVVIQYQHFGRTNNPTAAPANLGRTATHEVGHWLGLRHIWGDADNCIATDFVHDTPNQLKASSSDCNKTLNTCVDSLVDLPDMVENYMDYSSDICMNSFTKGQSQRMWSQLFAHRMGLFTSDGCGGQELQVMPDLKNILCFNNCDGEISLDVYGGTPPYSYSWSHVSFSSPTVSGLCQGSYTVTITDSDAASSQITFNLNDPQTLVANLVGNQDISCDNCEDGSIQTQVGGGTGNYSYSWNTNPVQTTANANNLAPGVYSVVVSDGCQTITLTDSVVNPFVGINKNRYNALKVFPNPSTGVVYIENAGLQPLTVSVINLMGETVFSSDYTGTEEKITIDLTGKVSGIYFVKFNSKDQVMVKKVTLSLNH
ncbi:MAG: T9SS type A sorting domain-containing protein [Bacteroidetes bacterium]|nr:T9SS type A sorting domain-containing protein [Bacteroidota bacterium]HET6243743.1 M43 family zinc metalloprotease [Bacteroidia bacterium]